MTRIAIALCSALVLLPQQSSAQDAEAQQFAYCSVLDDRRHDMWASQVFAVTVRLSAWLDEAKRMAAEFDAHVATLGGTGKANCLISTQRDAEESRAEWIRIMSERSMGIRIYKWHDVQWTPRPKFADAVRAAPAAPPPPVAPDTGDIESDYWNRIVGSQHAEDFDDYLEAFPDGKHAPLARLEAKRLRRDGTTAPHSAVPTSTPAPSSANSVAPAAPARTDSILAVDDSIRERLASDAFFKIPAPEADAASVRRSGSRRIRGVTVYKKLTTQRLEDNNLCRVESSTATDSSFAVVRNATQQVAWAGLIPLSFTAQTKMGVGDYKNNYRIVRFDELRGQPFPLIAGNAFSLSIIGNNTDANSVRTDKTMWECQVGKSGPANVVLPGMAGEQTELKCTMRYEDKSQPTNDFVYHWFSAAGCFAQDPSRP